MVQSLCVWSTRGGLWSWCRGSDDLKSLLRRNGFYRKIIIIFIINIYKSYHYFFVSQHYYFRSLPFCDKFLVDERLKDFQRGKNWKVSF